MERKSKYDVAFSFLSGDLPMVQDLASQLEPGLKVFIYARKKEELLGGDGMDRLASVFKEEARLSVVLFREGWGQTPWTAFEESQIKDRALHSRMTSFLIVRLDDSPIPVWIPETHLYASMSTESRSDVVAIVRARARQQGAVIRRETATEYAVRLKREADAQRARRDRQASFRATQEAAAEVKALFADIVRSVNEIKTTDPEIDIAVGVGDSECAVASGGFSTSVVWNQPVHNNLRGAHLRVNEWHGRVRLPASGGVRTAGPNWYGARHYEPRIADSDEWVWCYDSTLDQYAGSASLLVSGVSDDDTYRTDELADYLVRRQVRRANGGR